jgi:Tfp pilus assembly protein PilV
MRLKVGAPRNANCRGIGVLEILIAMLIVAFSMAAIVNSYVVCARESDRAAYSLSAQSLALGRLEQVRAAKWDLVVVPPVDDVQNTNFPAKSEVLDLPRQNKTIYATNYTTISFVVTNPPLKRIQVDCVWPWMNNKMYTNTVVTYRGPDQR